jgi:hypothetical protein
MLPLGIMSMKKLTTGRMLPSGIMAVKKLVWCFSLNIFYLLKKDKTQARKTYEVFSYKISCYSRASSQRHWRLLVWRYRRKSC